MRKISIGTGMALAISCLALAFPSVANAKVAPEDSAGVQSGGCEGYVSARPGAHVYYRHNANHRDPWYWKNYGEYWSGPNWPLEHNYWRWVHARGTLGQMAHHAVVTTRCW